MKKVDKTLYDADSIQSLSPREHIRKRSGMYIGNNANPNQLLLEVFSNALDEHNIGHGNEIYVSLGDGGMIRVCDYGQGFPIDEMREDGKSVFEAAFSVVNTSGKFSDDGVYGGSALGLNGLGSKISNFLSSWFCAHTYNGGKEETITFEDGILVSRVVEKCDKDLHGTTVEFIPDPQFFDTAEIDADYFIYFFKDVSCLCPNLRIVFNDHNKTYDIKSQHGIEDLVRSRLLGKNEIVENRFVYHGSGFDVAMTFTDAAQATLLPYVNYGYTDSGPHITAIKTAITRIMNSWGRDNGVLKAKEKNIDGASLQEGLILALSLVSTGVSYNAQTKEKVVKCDTSFINEFSEQLEVWLDNNPEDGKKIIEKALIARRATEAARKAREAVKQKAANKKDKVFKLPTKLTDCWTHDRAKAELLICEGVSAASGLVAARNSEFQAVYGVRGKMLSVLKTAPDKVMKNQEINNIVVALGLDYNPTTGKMKYDKRKLRYDKIIACADADFDGYAIENLLFNILWYLCPELVINGHVYSSVPPLFRVTTKKNEYVYLKDEKALDAYKKKNASKIKTISREKGLGEMDSDELSHALLDPATRNVIQLQVSDIDETDALFKTLYGKSVEPRVKFILEHSEEARVE